MKKTLFLLGLMFINLQLFCQDINLDKLKKENQSLKQDNQILKQTNQKFKQDNLGLKNQIIDLQKLNDSIIKLVVVLKQDTTFLRNELLLSKLYSQANSVEIINRNNNFKFTFISCVGNRIEQKVKLTLMVEHNLPHQNFWLNEFDMSKGDAYDSQGNRYKAGMDDCSIGGIDGNSTGKIPTGIPNKITIGFNNVMPGNDLLKMVSLIFNSYNLDGSNKQHGTVDFKNIKVIWK